MLLIIQEFLDPVGLFERLVVGFQHPDRVLDLFPFLSVEIRIRCHFRQPADNLQQFGKLVLCVIAISCCKIFE